MMKALLRRIREHVDENDEKQLVVWSAMLTGFHMLLRKSNLVPLKRVHDTVHNISRSDVKYDEGVMVIFVRWSKTNQYRERVNKVPLVANSENPICLVHWLLYMMDRIPAEGNHNLFSVRAQSAHAQVVPITYRDLMVNMRKWLDMIGHDSKAFSSHSLCQGGNNTWF